MSSSLSIGAGGTGGDAALARGVAAGCGPGLDNAGEPNLLRRQPYEDGRLAAGWV